MSLNCFKNNSITIENSEVQAKILPHINILSAYRQKMAPREYVQWNAKGVENIPDDEAGDIQTVVGMFEGLHQFMFQMNGHVVSGTHGRSHGVVKGTFIVPEDLPSHLKQTELFTKGGNYPVVCRYSSSIPDPNVDVRRYATLWQSQN